MDTTRLTLRLRSALAVVATAALLGAGLVSPPAVGATRVAAPAPVAAAAAPAIRSGNSDSALVRYVELVYADLFDRAPDPTGLAGWIDVLDDGAPLAVVANGITGSTEYRSRLVTDAYRRYLDRGPDAAGLAGWIRAMEAGWTVARIEVGFVASPEYYGRAGGTDAAWVGELYADVLRRTADPAEIDGWTARLARGATRDAVAAGFLLSTEHLATLVEAHYQHLLGRGLDPTGRAGWVALLQRGGRDEELVAGIVASEEYWDRANVPGQIEVVPASVSVTSGAGQTFQVLGYTTMGALLGDMSWWAVLAVDGDPGACVGATCSVVGLGDHVVTATVARASATADLQVRPAAGPELYTLWTWGSNFFGELGDGAGGERLAPARIGLETHWALVASGALHRAGIKTDGTLWTWGRNASGELGDGTRTDRWAPVQVGVDPRWSAVSPGGSHTVAVRTDGSLWSWGENGAGQLGDGTHVDRSYPVQVGVGEQWVAAAAGEAHTLALRADGTLWAWGSNDAGQLGDGTTTPRATPGQVGTDATWATVGAGRASVAVRTDGTLWTWGANDAGQLGDGTTASRAVPAQVGSATDWSAAVTGGTASAALRSDGTLWVWGGGTAAWLAPVQVPSSTWSSVSAAGGSALGVRSDGTLWTLGPEGPGPGPSARQIGIDAGWAAAASGAALRP